MNPKSNAPSPEFVFSSLEEFFGTESQFRTFHTTMREKFASIARQTLTDALGKDFDFSDASFDALFEQFARVKFADFSSSSSFDDSFDSAKLFQDQGPFPFSRNAFNGEFGEFVARNRSFLSARFDRFAQLRSFAKAKFGEAAFTILPFAFSKIPPTGSHA